MTTRPDGRRRGRGGLVRGVVVATAAVAAIAPLPPDWIERAYSRGVYARLQPAVSAVSALTGYALLDAAAVVLLAAAIIFLFRQVRTRRLRDALVASASTLLLTAAVIYLWFLLFWGFNYRRLPLEVKLAYEAGRITRESGMALAGRAVDEANALAAAKGEVDPAALLRGLASVQTALGERPLRVAPAPKRSALTWYFRQAAIDGMTVPFFLEVIVNPDLLPTERPFVVAHEWAHLAGYADESEANFLAWLACLRADPAARYSGWLAAYQHIASGLPPADRRALAARVSPAVRADLVAERARFERSSPAVRAAAQGAYDTYLRANRIEEGIANYNAVVRLMLGVALDADGNPRRR